MTSMVRVIMHDSINTINFFYINKLKMNMKTISPPDWLNSDAHEIWYKVIAQFKDDWQNSYYYPLAMLTDLLSQYKKICLQNDTIPNNGYSSELTSERFKIQKATYSLMRDFNLTPRSHKPKQVENVSNEKSILDFLDE